MSTEIGEDHRNQSSERTLKVNAVVIVDRLTSLTEADIALVEDKFGISFPADLKAFYLAGNGGRPIPNLFLNAGEYFAVHEFLPIKYGWPGGRVEDTYADLVQDDGSFFPKNAIPFAIDAGGDYFFYSLGNGTTGEICFWQSDYFDDPKRTVIRLCSSLEIFLDGLVDEAN